MKIWHSLFMLLMKNYNFLPILACNINNFQELYSKPLPPTYASI